MDAPEGLLRPIFFRLKVYVLLIDTGIHMVYFSHMIKPTIVYITSNIHSTTASESFNWSGLHSDLVWHQLSSLPTSINISGFNLPLRETFFIDFAHHNPFYGVAYRDRLAWTGPGDRLTSSSRGGWGRLIGGQIWILSVKLSCCFDL